MNIKRESIRRFVTALLFSVGIVLTAVAQQFTVNAPQRVYKGEKFAVTLRLSNAEGNSEPRMPQINGCTLIFGPSVTTRQSYSVVNGHSTSQSCVEYTYTYRADKTGEFVIPAASISAGGRKFTTRQQRLTVTDSPAGAHRSPYDEPEPQRRGNNVTIDDIATQSADRAVRSNDVFVRIILSKPTAYEQEAIECTIKLYTKFGISQFFATKQPSFDGFLIEDVQFQSSLNQIETYNGERYLTALLKKCIIFPQKSGKLTINSGNYDLNVVQYSSANYGFLSISTPREKKVQVTSNSASIDIKPLPQPQPAEFSGAVGSFQASTKLVGNNFRTNEPSTLIYTITGTGNIKYIKEPQIDFPSEFELYTPKATYDTRVAGSNVTGSMTTEYNFVPKTVGKFTVPANKFVYFDPAKKEYITIDLPGYNINVGQGAEKVQKKDVEIKNTDILHIHSGKSNTSFSHPSVIVQWWYWLIYLLLIAGLIVSVKVYGHRLAQAADIRGMKLAKANKVARKRLRQAETFMKAGDNDKFYEEMLRAVWGYLSDKLAIPVSLLSRENISAELTNYGASPELCERFIKVLDECEMARYAPAESAEKLHNIYKEATESINSLETIKKGKKK